MELENPAEYFLNSELVVHAGGLSERWSSVTQNRLPKPITEIGKKPRPIIDWVILPFVMGGIRKIFVTLWNNPDVIIKHCNEIARNTGIEFVYLKEPEDRRLGRAGVIKYYLQRGILDDGKPKIFINTSDIIKVDVNELAKFQVTGLEQGYLGTMIASPSELSQFGRLRCDINTRAIVGFEEKPLVQLPKDEYVSTGAVYIDSKVSKHFYEIADDEMPVDLEKSKILAKLFGQMRCFEHVIPLKTWFWLKNQQDYNRTKDMDFEKFFEIDDVERYLGPYTSQNSRTQ
jgi:NDP-sugar pyrophosphorylase family protein